MTDFASANNSEEAKRFLLDTYLPMAFTHDGTQNATGACIYFTSITFYGSRFQEPNFLDFSILGENLVLSANGCRLNYSKDQLFDLLKFTSLDNFGVGKVPPQEISDLNLLLWYTKHCFLRASLTDSILNLMFIEGKCVWHKIEETTDSTPSIQLSFSVAPPIFKSTVVNYADLIDGLDSWVSRSRSSQSLNDNFEYKSSVFDQNSFFLRMILHR
jgi:hypothetical protein